MDTRHIALHLTAYIKENNNSEKIRLNEQIFQIFSDSYSYLSTLFFVQDQERPGQGRKDVKINHKSECVNTNVCLGLTDILHFDKIVL